ncbi:MAG TPA: hypothetical protein VKG24_25440 [Pseudolabrys sp.]|nr:hypothetical protein [Pseudolabrys sp.]
MSGDFELNEWRLLRDQFRALVRGGSDDIEEILDVHFRRRFSELIDRVAARKNLSAREAQ